MLVMPGETMNINSPWVNNSVDHYASDTTLSTFFWGKSVVKGQQHFNVKSCG
jgi:hypothetical protein